jgi:hypothetical protein
VLAEIYEALRRPEDAATWRARAVEAEAAGSPR